MLSRIYFLAVLTAFIVVQASRLDAQMQPREKAELDQMASLLNVSEGISVADVGAGSGVWSHRLLALVGPSGRVYATEVRADHVENYRQYASRRSLDNFIGVLGSQDEIGLPAGCCNAMLLRLVYHAFRNAAAMRVSMRRAMRPGGLVLIIDFRPAPDQLSRDLEDSGFERVQLIERWQDQEGVFAALFRRTEAAR